MIAVRFVDLVIIFLNWLLNLKLEKTPPIKTDRQLCKHHQHPFRRPLISGAILKLTIVTVVPTVLAIMEYFANIDENIVRDYFMLNFTVYTIVNILKLTTSRPRPFAQDVENKKFVWNKYFESRKSFPSGHAANGFISGITMAQYVVRIYDLKGTAALLAQLPFLLLGTVPGASQAIVKWHHWSDVLSGYALAFIHYVLYRKFIA